MTKILMRGVLTLALSITAVTAFAESHGQHANPQANSGIHHGQNNPNHDNGNHGKDHQSRDDKNSYGNSSQHASHQGWKAGAVLPRDYRGNRYQFLNYQQARLGKPAKNQQWLRINRDYVLVNVLNHQIIKVVAVR